MRILLLLLILISSSISSSIPNSANTNETDLTGTLTDLYFYCTPTYKIDSKYYNDDYCDCLIDEPKTSACNGRFTCRNRGFMSRYISASYVGDGYCDCCDGSDEKVCDDTCGKEADRYVVELMEKEKLYQSALEAKNKIIKESKDLEGKYRNKLLSSEIMNDKQITNLFTSFSKTIGIAWFSTIFKCLTKLVVSKKFGDMGVEKDYFLFEYCPFRGAYQYSISKDIGSKFELWLVKKIDDNKKYDRFIQQAKNSADGTYSLGIWWNMISKTDQKQVRSNTPSIDHLIAKNKGASKFSLSWHFLNDQKDKLFTSIVLNTGNSVIDSADPVEILNSITESRKSKHLSSDSIETYLGSNKGIIGHVFAGGQQCWNGPMRSVYIKLFCGETSELVFVTENGKCSYEFEVSTPLACIEEFSLKLSESINIAKEYFKNN